jgi:hypothetical protein
VQFDRSFVASGLATDPSFTVRYLSGEERMFTSSMVQDPTPYRLLPPALRPDPLWWVFEGGGAISSLTIHAPVFFASRLSPDFADVYGDLYVANLQVIDVPEPDVEPRWMCRNPASARCCSQPVCSCCGDAHGAEQERHT